MENEDYTDTIQKQVKAILGDRRASKEEMIIMASQDVEDYLLTNRMSVDDLTEADIAKIIVEYRSEDDNGF